MNEKINLVVAGQDTEASIWAQEECEWDWRRLHSEELRSLYSLPNIVRVIRGD
jgi:hypothetical protein